MVAASPEAHLSRYLHRFRVWPALVAACVILLQASAASFAAGMNTGPMLDAFGNPLCLSDSVQSRDDAGGDHAKLPSCCTLGCVGNAQLLSPPDHFTTAERIPLHVLDLRPRPDRALVIGAPEHDPGNPRAPPLTA